ncbi:Protein kinase domain-containing protein [Rhodoferax sp. OV413]|uniref:protein kinase domain-containing protein n=1 Tax=Rhodoferax sp. OV413 TaxID=1855285 RepID=UPI00088AA6F4|nr:protein kinase [Rhodoferax sp. OV413]SDP90866.1 Protein kinase domain-containing protein [Rhodoferax sp. OV413]
MSLQEALQLSRASKLVNERLDGGWTVVEQLTRPGELGAEDLTGSWFSFGYVAEKGGKKAFLKVVDVERALADDGKTSLMNRLKNLTDVHTFECDILDVCTKARLDKVVQILGKGEIPAAANAPMGIPIPYILFEHAEGGDARKLVSRSNKIDDAWRLSVLHQVAVGIQQLHSQDIAHQDLKPSNILLFSKDGSNAKIGDLGRASRKGTDTKHDLENWAGSTRYAPPEQVYGLIPEHWVDRREGCDLYHLGSLAIFLFTGVSLTSYYVSNISKDVLPKAWTGNGTCDYKTALPVLTSVFTSFIDNVCCALPEWGKAELSQIIISACNPDFTKRGDLNARKKQGNPIGIETFVSRFDRLAKRALVEVRQ